MVPLSVRADTMHTDVVSPGLVCSKCSNLSRECNIQMTDWHQNIKRIKKSLQMNQNSIFYILRFWYLKYLILHTFSFLIILYKKMFWFKKKINLAERLPSEQFREPDHQRVIAAGEPKLNGTGDYRVAQIRWLAKCARQILYFHKEDFQVLPLV